MPEHELIPVAVAIASAIVIWKFCAPTRQLFYYVFLLGFLYILTKLFYIP